jgi:hypothetical protein
MIVTKKALPRRTFLRGAGVALGLPLLDAMVPALSAFAQSPASAVRRLGFIYMPNGVAKNSAVDYWTPRTEGRQFETSPILAPLEPFRDRMLVLSGLDQNQAEAGDDGASGDHTRGTSSWLTGVYPKRTEGADVRTGISGYSCAYLNTLAWTSPTTPLPTENNPRIVFERLFGDGGPAERRADDARRKQSLLDSVVDDLNRLQRRLGPGDRVILTDYVDAVREVERRIARAATQTGEHLPLVDRPKGIPERFDEHVSLMYELQWLAFRADLTRVVTFMLGRELNFRTYPEIGVTEGHHGLSHHQDRLEQIAKYAKIGVYQAELFKGFLEKLRSTPEEGDGTLLDHSLFLYGAGLSNPNTHAHTDLPLLVVGGRDSRIEGNRHLQFRGQVPMTNLLLSLLDKVGVHPETLGDSNGRVPLEI